MYSGKSSWTSRLCPEDKKWTPYCHPQQRLPQGKCAKWGKMPRFAPGPAGRPPDRDQRRISRMAGTAHATQPPTPATAPPSGSTTAPPRTSQLRGPSAGASPAPRPFPRGVRARAAAVLSDARPRWAASRTGRAAGARHRQGEELGVARSGCACRWGLKWCPFARQEAKNSWCSCPRSGCAALHCLRSVSDPSGCLTPGTAAGASNM